MILKKELDYETLSSYHLVLEVRDQGEEAVLSASTAIFIQVIGTEAVRRHNDKRELVFPTKYWQSSNHIVHKVATAAFWRTFSHEGKISPGWGGGGACPPPLITFSITSKVAVYAPAKWADTRHTNPVSSLGKYVLCGSNGLFLWRTFHHDGKICPGWRRWGVHAHGPQLIQ